MTITGQTANRRDYESIRIKAQIIGQLEKYLSPDNVNNNPDFALQVAEGRIAVSALSGIVKNLTSDRQLLLSALKESNKFVLDLTCNWVTIRKQKERNVLILREIETDTSLEEVKKIFASFTDLPEIKNIHSDIGNNWFITFNNQDDCIAAALKLSTEGTFRGKPLKVRVKANLAQAEKKSSFASPASPPRRYSNRMPSYRRAPFINGGMYSPRRGRGGMRKPRRRGMPYPPPMTIGPRVSRRRKAPVAAIDSDYPGEFKQFTTEIMRDVIKRKFGAVIAPKPISLDSDEVQDIVTKRPKTTVNDPVRLARVPKMTEVNLNTVGLPGRADTRNRDKPKRKKGVGTARGGRPSQGRRASKPRGQKNVNKRGDKGGRKKAVK